MSIVKLYEALRADKRLQLDWESNQPRIDRCLEAPLIVNTPREVATAALLWLKLMFEPGASLDMVPAHSDELLDWAYEHRRDLCKGGPRLVKLLRERNPTAEEACAATASLQFYRDRMGTNALVRQQWSQAGLMALGDADEAIVVAPHLKVTGKHAYRGVIEVARFLAAPPQNVPSKIRFSGVGEERGDAIAVFGLRVGRPITDKNLWKLCDAHGILSEHEASMSSYSARQRAFASHWEMLTATNSDQDPSEIAATLYLWANEAARYGYTYEL